MWTLRGFAVAAAAAVFSVAALGRVDVVAARPFQYRNYGEMVAYLLELNATYPELVQVYVAQDKYALPYPTELTCSEGDEGSRDVPCKHYVVHLTNHTTLTAQPDRPQVFVSGALHGDERVGPLTAIEMIALVAKLSTAYAHPDSPEAAALANASSLHTQRWVHHLVNSRDVVLTPMTNAYGYAHDQREELGVDPNRDYNYMRAGAHCMQTMTSRVVNEIWRDHMFQLAITFHGGMRAISYEWGAPNHMLSDLRGSQKSPDDLAQAQLAHAMAVFAGPFADKQLYPTGTMNDIVYGVTGGMEDWGYAASWENQFAPEESGSGKDADEQKPFKPCVPTTFGGYNTSKTVYNNATHRAFNILVETSNFKRPTEAELGQFEDLYNAELDYYRAKEDAPPLGHVSQNVRLALMVLDMAQPYVRWVHAPLMLPAKEAAIAMEAKHEYFPSADLFVEDNQQLTKMGCGAFAAESTQIASCNSTKCHIKVEAGKPLKLQVAWEVLGAITVDKTNVQLASDAAFSTADIISQSADQKGTTRRFFDLADPPKTAGALDNTDTLGTSLFVSCVDLHTAVSKTFYVRAVSTVDQDWKTQAASGDDEPSPHIPPQSHYVNARTNPAWKHSWNGREIQGTVLWYSPTIEVTIEGASTETKDEGGSSDGPAGSVDSSGVTKSIAPAATSVAPLTTTPTPSATMTIMPSAAGGSPGQDEPDFADDDGNDDETATEPEISPTGTPKPADITTTEDYEPLSGVLKNDAKLENNANVPSLLSYGYLTLGLGGMVITLTLAYMYKRVFRSQRRTYMNINQQRPQRSTFSQPASPRDDDDEDDDDP